MNDLSQAITIEDTRAYIGDMAEQLARLAADIGDDDTASILAMVAELCAGVFPAERNCEHQLM